MEYRAIGIRNMTMKKYLLVLLLALAPISFALSADNGSDANLQSGFDITVNINTATAEELATLLQGIGLQKAQAIIEYREANGNFVTKDELTKVKGIGPALVARNEDRILL